MKTVLLRAMLLAAASGGMVAASAPKPEAQPHATGPVHAEPASADAAHAEAPPEAPQGAVAVSDGVLPVARLPGFAPWLANQPMAKGPEAWVAIPASVAWRDIAAAAPAERQGARWRYAISLLARGSGPEALGVLDVMVADDPDLTLVNAWQRAHGIAQIQARHFADGIASLSQPGLMDDPESCLWRMYAMSHGGDARAVLGQVRCAVPAMNARGRTARKPFLIAAVRAADARGRYDMALAWLAALSDNDSAANLWRGKAELALGKTQSGRLRLARVALSGTPEERAEASLSTIEHGVSAKTMGMNEATKRLDALLAAWRGDAIEERALRLSMRIAQQKNDPLRELTAGATLSRYFDLGSGAQALMASVQRRLAALLAPDSKLPLDQAIGLFWDYRDFAPNGLEGVRFGEALVARLQSAGLYGRAADLLDHRLTAEPDQDVATGPLSIRIASLRILDGDPDAAVGIIRKTDRVPYPAEMVTERRRLEAVALVLLGKNSEALATLEDVPDGAAISAEIYWQMRDWAQLERVGTRLLPSGRQLSEVEQAIVLRQAITSAMLGHADMLAKLRGRYARAFAGLPTAATFELLTGDPAAVGQGALAKAMAALPTPSPAGAAGDLLDAGRQAMAEREDARKT